MDVSLSELQEIVMDREAWRAVILRLAKIQTRLSDWTELNPEECEKVKQIALYVWELFIPDIILYITSGKRNKMHVNVFKIQAVSMFGLKTLLRIR